MTSLHAIQALAERRRKTLGEGYTQSLVMALRLSDRSLYAEARNLGVLPVLDLDTSHVTVESFLLWLEHNTEQPGAVTVLWRPIENPIFSHKVACNSHGKVAHCITRDMAYVEAMRHADAEGCEVVYRF